MTDEVLNVLLVDDDPPTLELMKDAVEAAGRHLWTAANGRQAWEIVSREKIHVVVSDMRMPEMDSRAYDAAGLAEVDDFVSKPNLAEPLRLRLRAAKRLLLVADRLRELEGIIPVCSYCRRLRDEKDAYQQMEAYFEKHASRLSFSHGICPDCMAKHSQDEIR